MCTPRLGQYVKCYAHKSAYYKLQITNIEVIAKKITVPSKMKCILLHLSNSFCLALYVHIKISMERFIYNVAKISSSFLRRNLKSHPRKTNNLTEKRGLHFTNMITFAHDASEILLQIL